MKLVDITADTPFDVFWRTAYLPHIKHKLGAYTVQRYTESYERYLKGQFADVPLGAIRTPHVRQFHAALQHIPAAANHALAVLGGALAFAIEFDAIRYNPARQIRKYRSRYVDRYLTAPEIAELKKALHWLRPASPTGVGVLELCLYTGARPSEILRAKWSDISDGVLVLPDSKNGRVRRIYLSKPAQEVLSRMVEEGHGDRLCKLPYNVVTNLWSRACRAAGIKARLYDLRHTFASSALAANVPLDIIGELLGHRDANSTKRYAHLMSGAARQAVARATAVIDGLNTAEEQAQ